MLKLDIQESISDARYIPAIRLPVPAPGNGFISYVPYIGSGTSWVDGCVENGALGR